MSGAIERAPGIDVGHAVAGHRRLTLKQALLGMAGALGLAAAATYGVHYWQVGRFLVETDDAYVQADSIVIAPRVAGYIGEVLVNDNQPVEAGQVLARSTIVTSGRRSTRQWRIGRRPPPRSPTWALNSSCSSR
jgi:hypothetical protein